MTAPRAGGGGAGARSAGGAMVRGVVLILVAVLLGVVVLRATDEPAAVAGDQAGASTRNPVVEEADRDAVGAGGTESQPSATGGVGEEPASGQATDDGNATEAEEDATGSGPPASMSAARPAADVSVLVANGSGVAGLAGELTDQVGAVGYKIAQPANLRNDVTVPASTLYYAEGYESEATALAATLTPQPPVAPLPDPAPVEDLRGADVLLVVGPDLAGD